MGIGVGATFLLEIVKVGGDTTTSLGTIKVPSTTATELNSTGGQSLQLDWADVSKETTEVIASDVFVPQAALKGALR